jgi:Ser/Thr protein kinase RdoA (MazF antagonist)
MSRKLIEPCSKIPFTQLPLRICHNDTKLSNFLFEQTTGRGLCLIDLDTLMPGYLLYDFGDAANDLIRREGGIARGPVDIDLSMLEAFLQGIKGSGLEIRRQELEWLPHGVVLMPLLHGIRALADYLVGDRYYRVAYPEQNLDRAGSLLWFAESTNKRLPEIAGLCKRILG